MKQILLSLALVALSGCVAGPTLQLSGPVGEMESAPSPVPPELTIGLVADSQLQTRTNFAKILAYRHPLADRLVEVSIRPPALDWSARALLGTHLNALKARGASAIFYLGDGANNGCLDELAAGFGGESPNIADADSGLLALLDRFREKQNVPVYFVLGNHDLLGAGSTGDASYRAEFCSDPVRLNRPLSKAEVIALVDRFNRGNSKFAPDWSYVSSYVPGGTETQCGQVTAVQHYTWGCYLAARVDFRGNGQNLQFLLLDTNDWASVTRAKFAGLEQLGLWGGMSFGTHPSGVLSQTDWLIRNSADFVPLRVALMHYDVRSLQKRVLGVTFSRLSQRFADLFSNPGNPRTPRQQSAVAISAHTHAAINDSSKRRFKVGGGGSDGEKRQAVEVVELNIGSTTDFSNYSTLVQFGRAEGGIETRFTRLDTVAADCGDVFRQVASWPFPNEFRGHTRGWRAIGIDPKDRRNYRKFKENEMDALWKNLDHVAGSDPHKAACIGRLAAVREEGFAWPADAPKD